MIPPRWLWLWVAVLLYGLALYVATYQIGERTEFIQQRLEDVGSRLNIEGVVFASMMTTGVAYESPSPAPVAHHGRSLNADTWSLADQLWAVAILLFLGILLIWLGIRFL